MFFFNAFKDALGAGLIDLVNDDIYAVLVDEGTDVPVKATDTFLSDITSGARLGTPQLLTGKDLTDGVFTCDPITFPAFTGATVEGVLFYQYTGNAATSRLIAYQDGKFTVTCAVGIAATATSIKIDPLLFALPDNFQLAFSGGQTVQLNGAAAQGARSLTIDSSPGTVAAGETATGVVSGCGLPTSAFVSQGLQVTFTAELLNL